MSLVDKNNRDCLPYFLVKVDFEQIGSPGHEHAKISHKLDQGYMCTDSSVAEIHGKRLIVGSDCQKV